MMKPGTTIRRRRKEAGIALLIAIFVLLLIGVVAIALVVSSGTESALAGNYRASSDVYYAALAGVEEVRARLRSNDPNSFIKLNPGTFLPAPGTPLASCSPVYVLNPGPGEVVTPWDSSNSYYDQQFGQEFGAACGTNTPPSPSPNTTSVWRTPGNPLNGLPFAPPPYKWVRISAITEQSLQLDVFPYDGIDPKLIYYDSGQQRLNDQGTGAQVFEITALAALPNNARKLVQYLMASNTITFPGFPGNLFSLPAALTIAGNSTNGVAFSAPAANTNYYVSGADLTPTCGSGPVHAIGVFDNAPDKSNVVNGGNGGTGIPAGMQSKYAGVSNPAPDVVDLIGQSLVPSSLQSPAQVDLIAQTVIQNADAIIPSGVVTAPLPTINGSQLSAATPGMTSSNPMTVVVNGNLDLTGWHNTGYGLLLVTGNLNYDPDAIWNGLIFVIGQGTVTGSMGGSGEIDGEVFVAKTRDPSLNLLSSLGKASLLFGDNLGGNGIRYSSCWVQKAQPVSGYKVLSFHEVSQ